MNSAKQTASTRPLAMAIETTSPTVSAAALPNTNSFSPALPVGRRCTIVSSTTPKPKKMLNTIPSAASSLMSRTR